MILDAPTRSWTLDQRYPLPGQGGALPTTPESHRRRRSLSPVEAMILADDYADIGLVGHLSTPPRLGPLHDIFEVLEQITDDH